MINLQVSESCSALVDPALLEKAAAAALQYTKAAENSELSIVISNNAELQQLNLTYLGLDQPTDVLSFPSGDRDPDSGFIYLGDVVISCEKAAAQAEAAGHPLEQELCLLVIHGTLHLLGFDHAEEEQKASMWSAQEAILSQCLKDAQMTANDDHQD